MRENGTPQIGRQEISAGKKLTGEKDKPAEKFAGDGREGTERGNEKRARAVISVFFSGR